jgi:hypothetical protein
MKQICKHADTEYREYRKRAVESCVLYVDFIMWSWRVLEYRGVMRVLSPQPMNEWRNELLSLMAETVFVLLNYHFKSGEQRLVLQDYPLTEIPLRRSDPIHLYSL